MSWENVFQLKVSKSVIMGSYDIMGERFLTQSDKNRVTISWENFVKLKVSKSVNMQSYDIMGERFFNSKCQKG